MRCPLGDASAVRVVERLLVPPGRAWTAVSQIGLLLAVAVLLLGPALATALIAAGAAVYDIGP